jgi:hypothetical protein
LSSAAGGTPTAVEDLREAWSDLVARGRKWKTAAMPGLKRLPPALRDGPRDLED